MRDTEARAFVLELSPEGDFLPRESWAFADLDPTIRERATDFEDPFTFGSLFIQQVRAEVVLSRGGVPTSASEELIDVCAAIPSGLKQKLGLEELLPKAIRTENHELVTRARAGAVAAVRSVLALL